MEKIMTLDPEIGSRERTDFYLVMNNVCIRQSLDVLQWRTDSGLRPSDEWLQSQGYYQYSHLPEPEFDIKTEKVIKLPFSKWIVNNDLGTVSPTYEVVKLSINEQEDILEKAWEELRLERLRKLVLSDFTQLADSPYQESKDAWTIYRQQLRDLPDNTIDPFNPIWPDPPQ